MDRYGPEGLLTRTSSPKARKLNVPWGVLFSHSSYIVPSSLSLSCFQWLRCSSNSHCTTRRELLVGGSSRYLTGVRNDQFQMGCSVTTYHDSSLWDLTLRSPSIVSVFHPSKVQHWHTQTLGCLDQWRYGLICFSSTLSNVGYDTEPIPLSTLVLGTVQEREWGNIRSITTVGSQC